MIKIKYCLVFFIIASGMTFENDGINIYYQHWAAKNSGTILVIVHGFGEHGDRYTDLAEYLVERNISVYALDLRGHGRSEGGRGHVDDFDDYISDLDKLIKIVKEREGNKRIFLLGHSLGSIIVLEYADRYPVDGVIVSGVTFDSSRVAIFGGIPLVNKIPIHLMDISARLFGKKAISSLCSNESALEDYLNDDLAHGTFTLKFLKVVSEENEKLKREGVEIKSCLILMGSEDSIGSIEDARWLYSIISTKDKRLMVYEGMKHNIFDELDNERVFSDVCGWISKP